MKKLPLFIIVALSLYATACKEQKTESSPKTEPLKLKAQKVEVIDYYDVINCSGRITSEEELKLSFKTGGVIEQINVKEGQKVKKGDILARLDLSEIEAQAKQASMAVEKAERDFARVQNLYNDSVATLEQYQDMKTALDIARSVNSVANFNLAYSTIKAPDNGMILKILSEENEIVGSGYPVIFFGSNQKSWVVKTSVTDNQVVKMNLGDESKVFTDAYPDTFFNGLVTEISNFADPYTGLYDITIQLETIEIKLVSGLIVKNEITTKSMNKVMPIPYESLINSHGNNAYVYIIENRIPVKKRVTIFKLLDKQVLVKEGITPGDMVLTENVNYIKNGDTIEVTE